MVFVYEILNEWTRDRYIGVAKNPKRRFTAHVYAAVRRNSRTHFHRAIRKYGPAVFRMIIRAELPTADEAKLAEKILIASERPEYNMTSGGDGSCGRVWTEESKQLISRRRGWKHSEEAKAKIGSANRGRKPTEETREKLRQARKRRVTSEETRRKMSEAQRRRRAQHDQKQAERQEIP